MTDRRPEPSALFNGALLVCVFTMNHGEHNVKQLRAVWWNYFGVGGMRAPTPARVRWGESLRSEEY
jgi:hypothetical protein